MNTFGRFDLWIWGPEKPDCGGVVVRCGGIDLTNHHTQLESELLLILNYGFIIFISLGLFLVESENRLQRSRDVGTSTTNRFWQPESRLL